MHASAMRDLFGGAVQAAVPAAFADVSQLRQIPDNQEVFAHADSDRSVIFELLEAVDTVPSSGAAPALFHWHNLAAEADAADAEILFSHAVAPSGLSPGLAAAGGGAAASVACGRQRVAKFRDAADAANTVRVALACVRLPRVATDVLVVLNEPVAIHAESSSARAGCAVGPVEPAAAGAGADAVPAVLQDALSSLTVRDWGVFGS